MSEYKQENVNALQQLRAVLEKALPLVTYAASKDVATAAETRDELRALIAYLKENLPAKEDRG